jgi:polyhydroxybutyrate depolymerase
MTWQGCQAALSLIRVQGGGHTWPNGDAYLDSDRIGRVERDFGSEGIMEFFLANSKP